ncbi:MAG: glycosyltransferase family 4 protein [Candidatus Korarchaeum sp.]
MLRVALVAFYVRGAMGHYLDALIPHIAEKTELHLFLPDYYDGRVGGSHFHSLGIGRSRPEALLRFLKSLGGKGLWEGIEDVDLIHLFSGEGCPFSLHLTSISQRRGIPLLITLHDPSPHPGNLWEMLDSAIRRFIIPKAHSVHVHSEVFREAVLKLGARRVKVIPHGSIAERFTRYRRDDVSREPVALFFGRMEAYKGLDTLVRAALMLNGRMRFVIAGPGRIPGSLLNIIGRNPHIFELHNRYLSDEEVVELFQRSSVLVLPYKHATQSSLPLIAASFGLPVVATAVGAFLEDVPRVGGILVPPREPKALAEAILRAKEVAPRYPRELEMRVIADRFVEWYREAMRE